MGRESVARSGGEQRGGGNGRSFDRQWFFLIVVLILGYAARVGWILSDKAALPHPDLPGFIEPSLHLINPFNTGMREPGFVWWLWLIRHCGITSFIGIRLVTAVWFFGTSVLLFLLSRHLMGRKRAWAVVCLYAFLPTQIQADGLGMRHLVESFGMAWMAWLLLTGPTLTRSGLWIHSAVCLALLVMTRVSFLGSGALMILYDAIRRRTWVQTTALAPALLLLLFHLRANERQFGDPFYTVNIHSYWFANAEFIGKPGFPSSFEDWQKNPHQKSLTYREWMFDHHTPAEIVGAHLVGYFRFFWYSPEKTYFPSWFGPLRWLLLGALLVGYGLAPFSATFRPVLILMTIYAWPYAFPGHVHWAGRFFVPVSFLFLMLVVGATEKIRFLLDSDPTRFQPLRDWLRKGNGIWCGSSTSKPTRPEGC